ncbi:uncharacterized protein LOC132078221 [Ammospiza nelsoni]|uniref:uncharacterized protein LOC132078221 n=1 Tax=Ammospiza nelsoni TaxID=2857394 RepID=UPI002869A919|nr:uncharacterized protein LOC132078221 [Ammospiza nelsoni]
MYFLQLESWLGLNVFLFLFCPGLPNLYFLTIWRSQCYTFFQAGDREQQRGRPGTENRALFCAPVSSGNTFWPPQTCALPTGGRTLLSLRRAKPPRLPSGQAAPTRRRARPGPIGHERGSAVSAGRAQAGRRSPAVRCGTSGRAVPASARTASLLPAADSSLGPRPEPCCTNHHTDTKQKIRPCPDHLEPRTRFPQAAICVPSVLTTEASWGLSQLLGTNHFSSHRNGIGTMPQPAPLCHRLLNLQQSSSSPSGHV